MIRFVILKFVLSLFFWKVFKFKLFEFKNLKLFFAAFLAMVVSSFHLLALNPDGSKNIENQERQFIPLTISLDAQATDYLDVAFVKPNLGSKPISATRNSANSDQFFINQNISFETQMILDIAKGTSCKLNNDITGSGEVFKLGGGNLIVSQPTNYIGQTTIYDGCLIVTNRGTLGSESSVAIDGGTLIFDFGISSPSIKSLSGGSGELKLNNKTLHITQEVAGSFNGIISGERGGLSKDGQETLTLGGINTYGGLTSIVSGMLVFTADTSKLSGQIANHSILKFNQKVDSSFNQAISGSGSLIKTGTGTLTLSGNNTYLGKTVVLDGNLLFSGNVSHFNSDIILDSGNLIFDQSKDHIFSQSIVGNGALTKKGSGKLTLSGESSYLGPTTILNGVLSFAADVSKLGHDIVLSGGDLVFDQASDSTYHHSITGSGTLFKQGAGNLTLAAQTNFTGKTVISDGALTLNIVESSDAALEMEATAMLILAGKSSTKSLSSIKGSPGTKINLNGNALELILDQNSTFEGQISGTGGIIKRGNSAATETMLTLTAPNNYSGYTIIDHQSDAGGITLSGTKGSLGYLAPLSLLNHGTLVIAKNAGSKTIGSLDGQFNSKIDLNNNNLVIFQKDHKTFAGVIHGTAGITKEGFGVLTLTNAQAYSGSTSILQGMLMLNQGSILSSPHVHVGAEGALVLASTTDTTIPNLSGNGRVIFGGINTLTLGNSQPSSFSGKIVGPGSIIKIGVGKLTLNGENGYSGPTIIREGMLALCGDDASIASSSKVIVDGILSIDRLNIDSTSIKNLSGSGKIHLGSSKNLTIKTDIPSIFEGVISDSKPYGSGLTKQGASTLTLTNVNTYSGLTTINSGEIIVSGVGSLGTGLALSSKPGPLTINGGSFIIANDSSEKCVGSLSGHGGIIHLNNNALNIVQDRDSTYYGVIHGQGGKLTISGSKTLTLSGLNYYTGATIISSSGGGLTLIEDGAIGRGAALIMDEGSLTCAAKDQSIGTLSGLGGKIHLNQSTLHILQNEDATFRGTIDSCGGGLTVTGNGTLTLTNSHSYTGPTTISNGKLTLLEKGTLGNKETPLHLNEGVLMINSVPQFIGSLSAQKGTIYLFNNSLTVNQQTNALFDGSIDSSGAGFNLYGTHTLTLSQANTYKGMTTISSQGGGIVLIGNATLGDGQAPLTLNSGTISLTSIDQSIGTLSGLGGVINLNANKLIVQQDKVSVFHGKIISEIGGSLVINGDKTLTLTNSNLYQGPTIINSGEVALSGMDACLGLNSPLVMNGGSLNLMNSPKDHLFKGLSGSGGSINLNKHHLIINQMSDETFNGVIYSNGGGLVLNGDKKLILTANHSYTGPTVISSGGIILKGAESSLGKGSSLALDGGDLTIDFSAQDKSIGSLSGNSDSSILNLNQSTLRIDQTSDALFAGIINGENGSVHLTGSKTLTLSNQNNYKGSTTIASHGGGITLIGSGTIGEGADLILNSGELTFAAFDQNIGTLSGLGGRINLNQSNLSIRQDKDACFSGVIESQGGGLNIEGKGVLTLTAKNTYTGATIIANEGVILEKQGTLGDSNAPLVINGAHLTLNSSDQFIGSLSGRAGTIFLNKNKLTINQSNDAVYSGHIIGKKNSCLIKNGASALTLAGKISYEGPTIINQGSLEFAGEINELRGEIINYSTVVFNTLNDDSFNYLISGKGSLVKQGNKALTLGFENTYSGKTTVLGGTLNWTKDTSKLQGDLSIATHAQVVFDQELDSFFKGAIEGGGSLIKQGVYHLKVLAPCSYSGITRVLQGVLTFAEDTSKLSGKMEIGSCATVVFDQNSDSSFNREISGHGTIIKKGKSTFALTCPGSFDGQMIILDGTLKGDTSNLSHSILLGDNTVEFHQTHDAVYLGKLISNENAGVLNKTGPGMLTLSGDLTKFTGETNVLQGQLIVDGVDSHLHGTLNVAAGASLQGVKGLLGHVVNHGTIILKNINPVSLLSDRDEITTPVQIQGSFVQGPEGNISIEVNSSGLSDHLMISKDAKLDGYVHPIVKSGIYLQGAEFPILSASEGLNETQFAGVIQNPKYSFALDYQDDSKVSLITLDNFMVSFFDDDLTGNAKQTYNYLFSVINPQNSNLLSLQNTLLALPTLSELNQALLELCPAQFSALPLVSFQNNVRIASVTFQQGKSSACSSCSNDLSVNLWMEPIGYYYNQKGVQEQFGFDNFSYGIAAGALIPLSQSFFFNPAAGVTHSNLMWNNSCGKASSNTVYFSPSFGCCSDKTFANIVAQGSIDFYNTTRQISFTGFNSKPTARFKSYNILCGLEFGTKVEFTTVQAAFVLSDNYTPWQKSKTAKSCNQDKFNFYVQPEMQFYFVKLFQDQFSEGSNSTVSLEVRHLTSTFVQPNLGLKFIPEFYTSHCCISPIIYLGYLSNIPVGPTGIVSECYQLSIPIPNFTVNGYHRVINQLSAGLQVVIKNQDNFQASFSYNLDCLSHMNIQMVSIKLNWNF